MPRQQRVLPARNLALTDVPGSGSASGNLHVQSLALSFKVFLHNISRAIAVAAATMLFPVLVLAQEQEKKIQRSALPPAVEKTVVEQSKGSTIRGSSQEKENGQTYYEAELMVNGHTKDVLVDVTGSVVEVEEQVSMNRFLLRCGRAC